MADEEVNVSFKIAPNIPKHDHFLQERKKYFSPKHMTIRFKRQLRLDLMGKRVLRPKTLNTLKYMILVFLTVFHCTNEHLRFKRFIHLFKICKK